MNVLDQVLGENWVAKLGNTEQPRAPKGSPTGGQWVSYKSPKLPGNLYSRTAGEATIRASERVKIMEQAFPGVKFSPYAPNPAAHAARRRQVHIPAYDEPGAILDSKAPPLPEHMGRAAQAIEHFGPLEGGSSEPGWTGYARYNTIKAATGLTYAQVFGAINAMRATDPYSIRQSVDRLGKNVYVQIKKGAYA